MSDRLESVTLFEDRAEVRRVVTRPVPAGCSWVAVEGVSPFVDERTVQAGARAAVAGEAATRAGVVGARVRWRSRDGGFDAAELSALDERLADAGRRSVAAEHRRERAETRIDRTGDLLSRWAGGVAAAPRTGRGAAAGWRAALDALVAETDAALADRAAARRDAATAEDERRRAEELFVERAVASPRYEAVIEVQVDTERAADLEVTVIYRVPCALWRPEHLIRLLSSDSGGERDGVGKPPLERDRVGKPPLDRDGVGKPSLDRDGVGKPPLERDGVGKPPLERDARRPSEGAARIEVVTYGTVWQRTGEAWSSVPVRLSTARPARGATAPLLTDDLVRSRRRSDDERNRIDVEARDQEIVVAGLGRGQRELDEMPGVDDGGEPLRFAPAEPVTVASDGRPVRVEIGRVTLDATVERVAWPELGPVAHLRATATLVRGGPLLAGPVRVARGGSLVGRAATDFVGAGEPFEIGFGPDDAVRVRRLREESRDTTAIMGTQKIKRTVRVFVSNLSDEAKDVLVVERVPVSEIDDVEITVLDAGGFEAQGADGILRRRVALAPRGTERLELVYEIRAGSKVVLPF